MKNLIQALTAGFGATLTILILAYLREYYGLDLWLMAPFGATTVLVFGLPASPLAQPKNVIFGHLITGVIGLVFVRYVGAEYWALALATGMGVFAMLATKTTHPPAGANPILIMLIHPSWTFLINPVLLGAVVIVFVGLVYQKFIQGLMKPSN
ncbi:HPP family protein [Vibrio sp. DW001]|uniref:HPP family protein n=1 Tax=Vibrio sp. DW001 TaxID=2912315 RepID=UPI0023AF67B6|nr:HPP family protein [Vibrio sp. DW001]WED28941.1 HPP family protein [Vibrio sp. DW001]